MKLLQEALFESARKYPENIAFDDLKAEISFSEMSQRVGYLAGALQNLGIRKGDRVAILAENSVEYIIYHYATCMIGGILLVLNTRLSDNELIWIVNQAEASTLVVDNKMCSHLPALTKETSIRLTISIGDAEGVNSATDQLIKSACPLHDLPSLSTQNPVLLIYTSGTTGKPKGALQTHEGSIMADKLAATSLNITPSDVYLAFMPYFHQASLIRTRATLLRGGKNVVAGKLNGQQVAHFIQQKRVTIGLFPAPIDNQLSEIAARENFDLSSLRVIIGPGGGGVVQAERDRRFCEKYHCEFLGIYGQTECTGTVTTVTGKDYFKNPYICGKAQKGIDLEIWSDLNQPLPPGEVGEIMIRGKITIPGYWRNELGSAGLYTGKWLHTGDLGKLDKNGFLYFVGRKKELIKTGGENVYPKEVEDILREHDSILDLSIIGLPDPGRWGEVVTLVAVLKPGQDLSLETIFLPLIKIYNDLTLFLPKQL